MNYQHLPCLEEGRSLHGHENFGELSQILTGKSQIQTVGPNPSEPLPASTVTDYIQPQRYIHEMSSNGAHP